MSSDNNGSSGGMGVGGVLGIVFVVLKLVGVIDWPWVWVLCPFWIMFAIALVIFIVIMLGAIGALGISGIIDSISGRRKKRWNDISKGR